MKNDPLLYTFRRCPYAIRARLALASAKISYQPHEVSLRNKPESLLKYSPKGTVPVLVLSENKIIDESLDIMLWALERKGSESFIPRTSEEKKRALVIVKQNDTDFKRVLDQCKYHIKYSQTQVEQAIKESHTILSAWDLHLKDTLFFNGDVFGFLDMALLPFVRQYSKITPDIFTSLKAPYLKAWLKKCILESVKLKVEPFKLSEAQLFS